MSTLQDVVLPEPQTFDSVLKETKTPLRSWRKKYRKMKLRFDKAMDESNALFRDCHKLDILAKRLQEENECVQPSTTFGTVANAKQSIHGHSTPPQ